MDLFLIIVVVLFALAISDLVVGVSNDAVNFLNSAVGSKVAPRYIIMIIASLGILAGTTFSSGLMEVARKGIFNPEFFFMPEIMIIFLAVMLTDVMLLDLFNTFGLPTSTTVSIVFELLGASVAVSLIKIAEAGDGFASLVNYINTGKALAIISGILLSVVVAFSLGALMQFFTRLVFTFDFAKRLKRYGAIWGGIALTAITFFIVMKGAKGSSFMTPEMKDWIKDNTWMLIVMSFTFWTVIFQFILWFTKINILKPIVLVGTFALALAFAANDLVNFIGVPLAGLSTYNIASGSSNPLEMLMVALREPVSTNTLLLLIAGAIMVVTLWVSRKARSVTRTEVNLGRQGEGFERFESSYLSKIIVRINYGLFTAIQKITPYSVQRFVAKRINPDAVKLQKAPDGEYPSFDMFRASVNMIVASIIISFATSLKLPLSTTYVTFMVAMGTSLSDRAWGRESAVYRVNGVLTVIGGWFFTAFMAFTAAAIFAVIISYGQLPAIIALIGLAGFFIFRTHYLHRKREKEEQESDLEFIEDTSDGEVALKKCLVNCNLYFEEIAKAAENSTINLARADRKKLKKSKKDIKKADKLVGKIINDIFKIVKLLGESEFKDASQYGKAIGSIQEIQANMVSFTRKSFNHIDNNHKPPNKEQGDELKKLGKDLSDFIALTIKVFESNKFMSYDKLLEARDAFNKTIRKLDKSQVSRIKKGNTTSRNSLLFLDLLSDTENIVNHICSLAEACRDNFDGVRKA